MSKETSVGTILVFASVALIALLGFGKVAAFLGW